MITLRMDGEEVHLEPEEWRRWVEDGRIPPQAWVLLPGGTWMRAASLPDYRALAPAPPSPPAGPLASLREVLFPRRGLSATETLILANLVSAGVLIFLLRAAYLPTIRTWTTGWWYAVGADRAYWWWIPTLFLHAGARHLIYNMIALVITAGAVEFLAGRFWTYAVYLVGGTVGMVVSYAGHGNPPLSIGASGAIYGLAGAAVVLLLRRRRLFTYRQRWKTWRVYVPLFLVLALPSLLQADYWGHSGGLLGGLLLGLFVPPHRRVRELAALPDDFRAPE